MRKKVWIDTFSFKRKIGIGAYILTLFKMFNMKNILYQAIELSLHQNFSIEIDWYCAFRFKYRYYGKHNFLTLFIFGIQIPVFKMGGKG